MTICVQKVGLIMNALVLSSMTSVCLMEHSRSTFPFHCFKRSCFDILRKALMYPAVIACHLFWLFVMMKVSLLYQRSTPLVGIDIGSALRVSFFKKNSRRITYLCLMIYKFFNCSSSIPSGLSAYIKTIETCGLLLLYTNSEDMQFFHEFTGTINHSWSTNQSVCIDLVNI